MKNILAENMIRFGTKNLSESAKLILTEQNDDYWSKVSLLNPKSKAKQKVIDYPEQELKDPKTGLTLAISDSTGHKSELLLISAKLTLYYNESVSYAAAIDGKHLTSRFNYYARFFMRKSSTSQPGEIGTLTGVKMKNGKFYELPQVFVGSWIASQKSAAVYPAKDANDDSLENVGPYDQLNHLGNFIKYRLLPGYTNYTALNDIVTKMNTELAAAGYQQITKLSNESPK